MSDRYRLLHSNIVDPEPDEDHKQRHSRRWKIAMYHLPKLQRLCLVNGWTLRLLNDDHLIEIIARGQRYEWWPSTAKLIVNRKSDASIHCHDYRQLVKVIEKKVI